MKLASTIDEQIKILIGRGLIINDEMKAHEQLLDIGYYRLGFYSFPFEQKFPNLKLRDHLFRVGTKLEDIIELYYFDNNLRDIILCYINRIEVNIRTKIVYICSMEYKHNPYWFVDKRVVTKEFSDDFDTVVYSTIIKNPVIKRHHQKYTNDKHAPAWKTMEFMTLGAISTLFDNLSDRSLKERIAKEYGCSVGIFIKYLKVILRIRNSCAHGACIYNYNEPKGIPQHPARIDKNDRHNIKGAISVIRYILNKVSANRADDFDNRIKSLVNKTYSDDVIKIIKKCTNLC